MPLRVHYFDIRPSFDSEKRVTNISFFHPSIDCEFLTLRIVIEENTMVNRFCVYDDDLEGNTSRYPCLVMFRQPEEEKLEEK